MFNAVLITQDEKQKTSTALTSLDESSLPDGDVTIRVTWSTLNYKDALAITGKGPVVRQFPMVPGIDLVGVVEHSDSNNWKAGEAVLINGWGMGEAHWGGLSQYARVKSEWLTRLPDSLAARQAMSIGTAGYTAMLSLMALEKQGLAPEKGNVLVTGSSGGVGSFAIMLLARQGYNVIASTGRLDQKDYLEQLGAAEILHRDELARPGRPLGKPRWAGVVDCVGSHTLVNACAQTRENGVVAACGLAQGMDLPGTVAPFILRGISLLGINSVTRTAAERDECWRRLAAEVDTRMLEKMTQEVGLAEVINAADNLLAGRIRGRIVVNVNR